MKSLRLGFRIMYSSGKLKNIILVEIFEIVAKPQKLKKEVDFFLVRPVSV